MAYSSIKRILINGFPNSEDTSSIELKELSKVNSVVGPNGTGKTSLLLILMEGLAFIYSREIFSKLTVKNEWIKFSELTVVFNTYQDISLNLGPIELNLPSGSEFNIIVKCFKGFITFGKISWKQNVLTLKEQDNYVTSQQLDSQNKTTHDADEKYQRENNKNSPSNLGKLQRELREHQSKLEELKDSKFIYNSNNDEEVAIARDNILELLTLLSPPKPKFIPHNKEPAQNIKKLLRDIQTLQNGRVQEVQKATQIKSELEEILEGKIEVCGLDEPSLLHNGKEIQDCSHGTRICLYYYSMVYDLEESSIILWDEPENGLHPSRRNKVLDLIKSDSRQFFLATHASEFAPVLDKEIEVYKSDSQYNINKDQIEISYRRITNKRDAFALCEVMGIKPSTTLFTANALIWVEGPSDVFFWRHFLKDLIISENKNLVEGFDYTFMFYGGSLAKHLGFGAKPDDPLLTADLLTICKNNLVISDSDLSSAPSSWDLPEVINSKYIRELYLRTKEANKNGFQSECLIISVFPVTMCDFS